MTSSEVRLRKAKDRCLSLLDRYHYGERTELAKEVMVAEVEVVVGWLMETGLPPGAADAWLLKPVEENLIAKYGHEAGRRLNEEFLAAFERGGMPLIHAGRLVMAKYKDKWFILT